MNNIKLFGDREENEGERAGHVELGKSAKEEILTTTSSTTQIPSESINLTTPDLSWLAPPPRKVNGAMDHEWGLGSEKIQSSTGQKPSEALQAKLAHFHLLKEQGTHFNQSLNNNRSFQNPNIYAKLVDWIDVNENASGYCQFLRKNGKEVDKEEARKVWSSSSSARKELQQKASADHIAEMQKKRQEEFDQAKLHGKRNKIDFAPSSSSSSSDNKRRSKDGNRHRDSRHHRDRHDESQNHPKKHVQ